MMIEMNKFAVPEFLKPIRNFFGHDMCVNVDAFQEESICAILRKDLGNVTISEYANVIMKECAILLAGYAVTLLAGYVVR